MRGRARTKKRLSPLGGAARAAAAGAVVVTALVATAQAASASWLFQSTPPPQGATTWEFSGISCPATGDCVAVGSTFGNGTTSMLAETGSGSSWTIRPVTNPAAGQLNGVSCATATACTAVGTFTSNSTSVTLAERWDGSSWSFQAPANPSGATATQLNGVSCTSATLCTAVGDFTAGDRHLLAERWDGSTWQIQATPVPAGGSNLTLAAVSCTSADACTAVGSYNDGSHFVPLAERWDGTAWKIQATPSPAGFSRLDGVSCPTATACTAVGAGVAEHWNGTTWSMQTLARVAGSDGDPELNSISCAAATSCRAVGGFFNAEAIQTRIAESWSGGSKWSFQPTPISTSADSSLFSAVTCRSANSCLAAGSYHDPTTGNRALLESWALRWQDTSPAMPPPAITGGLESVTCPSTSACLAIGGVENNDGSFSPSVEAWDGSSWVSKVPPPNASVSNLNGVSCTAPTACTAVGDIVSGGGSGAPVPLAVRWNGTSWTAQSVPNPAGAVRAFLLAVSCTSATSCTATGFYNKSSGAQFTLAEHWDGTSWAVQNTPSPAGTDVRLVAVSCLSATACTAVGHSSSGALAENWNGSTWTVKSIPLPVGGSDGALLGVSCVTASSCTAVGGYFNGSHSVPLAERWNGSSWAAQPPAAPGGATSSGFQGVSCTSVNSCSAVGFFVRSSTQPLAAHWNGTRWSYQNVPLVSSAQSGAMQSVSCPSATACFGTGFFTDSTGEQTFLAQRYF